MIPPELMLLYAQGGGYMTPEAYEGWVHASVNLDGERLRFCPACDCSQHVEAGVPCWQCGGEMTLNRPKYWPANQGPTMLASLTPEGEEAA